MALEIGTRLGSYEIMGVIGAGGMGEVYRARDTRLRRDVAIKVLPAEFTDDPDRRTRFIREARACAAINHPCIATIHEVDDVDGIVFIAMELIEGETLRSRLRGGPLPMRDVLQLAVEMAEGLAHAHEARVIHRDLKPENIMIRPDRHPKILDFGLAKLLEHGATMDPSRLSEAETATAEVTREGGIVGTVAHMSPEQARGEKVDARSDIFSFGITLYEMATAEEPFRRKSTADTLSAILNQDVVPASRSNADVPAEMDRILAKCLEKDPNHRYQHTDDLVVDLKRLRRELESGSLPSPDAPRGGAVRSVLSRRMVIYAAAAILIAITAFVYRQFGPARESAETRIGAHSVAAGRRMIVVLPFENLGPAEDEYFAAGMTEEITSRLAGVRELGVISHTSASHYERRGKTMRQIGEDLGVDHVLEGSVRWAKQPQGKSRVRLTAQLIRVADDTHLWADVYEEEISDVFSIQSGIAQRIIDQLGVTLLDEERRAVDSRSTESPEAHQAYLRGRYFWNKRTTDDLRRAVRYFEEAIHRDPRYASAYAGLADCHSLLPWYEQRPPGDDLPKARESVLRALELDPGIAEAHTSLGWIRHTNDWDWRGAEQAYKRGIELNPSYSTGHHWYGMYLVSIGQLSAAEGELRQALQLDPLSLIINDNLSYVYFLEDRFDLAIEQTQKTIELDPNWKQAFYILIRAYEYKGMLQKAIDLAEAQGRAYEGLLGILYAKDGRVEEALRLARDLESDYQDQVSPWAAEPYSWAAWITFYASGDREVLFEMMERMFEEHSSHLIWMKVAPDYRPLHGDPRYQDLFRRLNLPE